jgi:hypothetical protein
MSGRAARNPACEPVAGKSGGNILDLVALIESCSIRDAALRIQVLGGSATGHTAPRPEPLPEAVPESNRPLGFVLRYVDSGHPYLAARRLTAETVGAFGIGAYSGRGLLRGRIVIPIHDERGELIAYAGRAIDAAEPKYRFPAGFRKSLVLFNLHRALTTGGRTVIVVEGFFDTLAVHQAGHPAVVGLMGSALSRYQTDLLTTYFDRVVLMLDGDEAGRQGAMSIAQTLGARMSVSAISLADGRQPDQLTAGEIQHLLTSCAAGGRPLC